MASTEFEPYLSVSPICEIGSLTTKIVILKAFFSAVGGAVFIINSKIHLRKSNLKAYLKSILHHFGLDSLSGSTADGCAMLKPVFDVINRSHRSAGKEPIHKWYASV